jgi:hypothetical protein
MNRALRLACLSVTLAASILPITVWSGDEDSKPGYMIYIDPETGKYTHEAPDSATQIVAPAKPAPSESQPGSALLIVAAGVLAALLVVGLVKHQRKQAT